ncbi:MAG: 2-hydroxyacyl-CoA dehydratase family protein [Thermodesulfobacteriota bacterium]|nr:2-hydroxyacyl-CoA dehydratase family protein [Thermodesulfobacteriota bacterium]
MTISMQMPPEAMNLMKNLPKTGDISLMDGSKVSPLEALQTCFTLFQHYTHVSDVPTDFTLANAWKHRYLQMGALDRAKNMKKKGIPLLSSFTVFPELIFGCGATYVSVMPCINEINLAGNFNLQQEGHRFASFESCPGEPIIALWIKDGTIPADLVLYGTSFGGDLPCIEHLLRQWPEIPLHYIDVPYNGKGRPWALDYVAEQLHGLVGKMGQISGRVISNEDLRKGIKMMNDVRRVYRDYADIVTSAKTPPIAGLENIIVTMSIWEAGDPIALKCATEQLNEELKERVAKGIAGQGVADDPIRIYMCEKMPAPPAYSFVESLGGILLGPEVADCFYLGVNDVAETGDPYEAIAKWYLEEWPWSPGVPLEERMRWVIDSVKKYNPDGIIFTGVWGCQLDPPFGRYMADTIKKELGIPSLLTILEDIPIEVGVDGKFRMKGDLRTRIEGFIEMLKARRGH